MTSDISEPTYNPTAARILATATRLFMQRGYSAVSVNDIVHAAEVTKPTLYYHFSDKEELFVLVAIHMLAEMRAEMRQALVGATGARGQLIALAQVLLQAPNGDTRMMRHQAREHLSPERQQRMAVAFGRYIFEPLHAVMQAGIDNGDLSGHPAGDLTMLFLGLMEGFQRQTAPPSDTPIGANTLSFTTDRFSAETIIDMFLHGTGARK